jgi:hypothetical protein
VSPGPLDPDLRSRDDGSKRQINPFAFERASGRGLVGVLRAASWRPHRPFSRPQFVDQNGGVDRRSFSEVAHTQTIASGHRRSRQSKPNDKQLRRTEYWKLPRINDEPEWHDTFDYDLSFHMRYICDENDPRFYKMFYKRTRDLLEQEKKAHCRAPKN